MSQKIALDKKQKQKLFEVLKKAKRIDKAKISSQDTIPFDRFYPEGIMSYNDIFSKTLMFSDISYVNKSDEVKKELFNKWKDILSSFSEDVFIEMSFLTYKTEHEDYIKKYNKFRLGGDFSDERNEYFNMISENEWKLSNGFERKMYLTYSVKDKDKVRAIKRLLRFEKEITVLLSEMGASPKVLSLAERLTLIYKILNVTENKFLTVSDSILRETGLTVKDIIAPPSFDFSYKSRFMIGKIHASSVFFNVLKGTETDRVLNDICSLDIPKIISVHIEPIDMKTAFAMVKRKVTDVDQMKIGEQKRAVRNGYDMDILSPELVDLGAGARNILNELGNKNEKLFNVTFSALIFGETREKLETNLSSVKSLCSQKHIEVLTSDFMQEDGFKTSLPLGINSLCSERSLTTSSLAVFFPFTEKQLSLTDKELLYYGMDPLSNGPVALDRKALRNPNGLIFGMPGGGKSFAAKKEILSAVINSDDDILICDPESEYSPLVSALGGKVIHIAPGSKEHINPLDLTIDKDLEDPLSVKSDFIVSLCELIAGGKGGMSQKEKSIIDRCIPMIYENYLKDPIPSNMPILGDLYDKLLTQPEKEASEIATALEIYTLGSLNLFNHLTDIDTNSRIVAYDIRDLGSQLKKMGMLIVQDNVWNRIVKNRKEKNYTRYYIDEMHLLLSDEQTGAYLTETWKRFRKWGGIPTGITQNVTDVLTSKYSSGIFGNTDFLILMHTLSDDRKLLSEALHLSPSEESFLENSKEGEGLICYDREIFPLIDEFPKNTRMYSLMTTKPGEMIC